jgi:hypothetical protein
VIDREDSLPLLARRVAELGATIRLVAGCTPRNFDEEVERQVAARRTGARPEPRFRYHPPIDVAGAADCLSRLAEQLEEHGDGGYVMAGRARELALEGVLLTQRETPDFRGTARRRYPSTVTTDVRASRWAALDAPLAEGEARTRSDDEGDPGSLVSSLRREVGRRCLPVRVVVREGLCPLAATGDGVVFVAPSRWLTARDVDRTVHHELEGHVVPALSRRASGVVAMLGRAGERDQEEGLALRHERAAGFLDRGRRKELGMRHVAACLAHDGVDLHTIADGLEALGAAPMTAVRIAARALRGGGLGRERVYLEAYFQASPPAGRDRRGSAEQREE